MNVIQSELNASISKLTDLLQMSLSVLGPENGKVISGAIVELISHTTQLSMNTSALLNDYYERESNLRACLKEMNSLVKLQQNKLQSIRQPASTSVASTMTEKEPCTTCDVAATAAIILNNKIDNLNDTVCTLQGKLMQSKCLIQAQQIIITENDLIMKNWGEVSTLEPKKKLERPHSSEPWGDLFSSGHPPKLESRQGIPPMQPNSRYSTANVIDEPEGLVDDASYFKLIPTQANEGEWFGDSDAFAEDQYDGDSAHEEDDASSFVHEGEEEERDDQGGEGYNEDDKSVEHIGHFNDEQEIHPAAGSEEWDLSEDMAGDDDADAAQTGWEACHEGSVDDSFSLIKNFYDVGLL